MYRFLKVVICRLIKATFKSFSKDSEKSQSNGLDITPLESTEEKLGDRIINIINNQSFPCTKTNQQGQVTSNSFKNTSHYQSI